MNKKDSESDEDAIVKAREDVEENLQNEKIMKSMPEPLALGRMTGTFLDSALYYIHF